MHKVIKDSYFIANVFLVNTDKASSLNLGKVTREITDILHKGGIDATPIDDKWDFEITKETADELARTTMKMKKPVRKKAEQAQPEEAPAQQETPKKPPVDLFNLIFGIEED